MATNDVVRGYLLWCAEAFAGRRGRTGVVNFLLGEGSATTLSLAAEQGIKELFAILKDVPQPALLQSFNALQQDGLLEVKSVNLKDKTLPLVYLTSRGSAELELLRPRLPVQSTSLHRLTDKMLLVLQRIATISCHMRNTQGKDWLIEIKMSPEQLQHYVQLLCKALHMRPEPVLTSLGSQQHFVDALERALCTLVFGELREVEAQCLRLIVGLSVPHQLDKSRIERYYGVVSVEEAARQAASRLVAREWQAKCQLVSVLGFLALGEGT